MKGRIASSGTLWILRNGIEKIAQCPHFQNTPCSDNCVKFREPKFPGCHLLKICGEETLEFSEPLVDERPRA